MAWTPKEQETVVNLWDSGSSALEISRALGTKTRNAVIGWLNRRGIGDKDRSVSYTMLLDRRRRERADLMALKRAARHKERLANQSTSFGKARKLSSAGNRRIDHQATGRIGFGIRTAARDDGSNGGESYLSAFSELHGHAQPKRNAAYIPGPSGVTMLNVKARMCRWPMSMDPRTANHQSDAPDMPTDPICGAPVSTHRSYCDHHACRAAKPVGGEA